MKNRYTLLGIAIISFAVVLISSFLIFFLGGDSEIDENNPFFFSKYISTEQEDLNIDLTTEENYVLQEEINSKKQGEIVLDENRKVIKFERLLSDTEKSKIENDYRIEFSEDEPVNGVYSIISNEQSNLEDLSSDEAVSSVETDIPVKISADVVDWGISRIGADKVWSTSSGSGVVVAIIDTGIQLDHPDLSINIVKGYDFVNNRTTALDDHGHGTHVAGIVAALSNQAGTVGASHTAKLMPIKALNSTGAGYISDVAKGVYWAVDNGAQIINMSLGASVDTDVLRNAVNYASNKGVLLVAAAGNDYGAPCQYPAAYSSVICVVATDSSNRLAGFSNIGGELSAPGVSNYSTFLNSSYRYLSGTSMASPHVAGGLAVIKTVCPTCSSSDLRNTLRETAIDLGEQGQDIIFGYGLVDLVNAVEKLKPTEEPEEETPIPQEPTPVVPKEPTKTTSPVKKGFDKQKTKITNPIKDGNSRVTVGSSDDLLIQFKLDPFSNNSGLDRTVLYLNNEPVYTTDKQEDEYTLASSSLTGIQQFIRVISFFKDGSQSHDQIILDIETSLRGRPVDNIIKRGRNVLGISTRFTFWDIFRF